jgi:DNA-binding Lrp family transcriptional regulator
MSKALQLDYFYGIEAEQFSFYRVPRLLIKDERFKELSSDAKLLYGLMLDRMSLSMKNEWMDSENRAYIIYTIEAIMDDLGCSKPTCGKILRELDCEHGIGLIERKRRGLGKPDLIYVKNFSSVEVQKEEDEVPSDAAVSTEVKETDLLKEKNFTSESKENEPPEVKESRREKIFTSGGKEVEPQEVKAADSLKKRDFTSRDKNNLLQEVKTSDPSYNNNNYNNQSNTDMSYIDLNHINLNQNETAPACVTGADRDLDSDNDSDVIDVMDNVQSYINLIKRNIEYDFHMKYDKRDKKELYDELFEVICEVVCVKRTTIRVAGEDFPYEIVKSRFLKLDSSHLEYVIECMHNTSTKITNIKAYMITALYNAQSTMNHYFQQEVQHDMFGGGWQDKGVI